MTAISRVAPTPQIIFIKTFFFFFFFFFWVIGMTHDTTIVKKSIHFELSGILFLVFFFFFLSFFLFYLFIYFHFYEHLLYKAVIWT